MRALCSIRPPEGHQACWTFIMNLQEGFRRDPGFWSSSPSVKPSLTIPPTIPHRPSPPFTLNNELDSSQNWSQNAQEEPGVARNTLSLPQEESLH